MKRRVVITGLGVLTAIGQDVEDFWSNSLAAKTCVSAIPEQWHHYADFNSRIWSPLPPVDYSKYGITRLEQKQLDETSLIALACAFQAFDSAGLRYGQVDKKRNTYAIESVDSEKFGVFMGTGIGGLSTFASVFSHQALIRQKRVLSELISELEGDKGVERLRKIHERLLCPKRFNPFGVSMTMPNACSGNIGIKFRLVGSSNTYCAACASGTVAIGHGFKSVRSGEHDLALVGGVEYLYDDYGAIFLGFDTVRALASGPGEPDTINRPFDVDRSGFLFSEGGGAVLLIEDLERARRRDAPIYGELLGYAETSDGYNIMMIEKSGYNIQRMIKKALADAALSEKDIDYINSHGTGTLLNDEAEARIIESMFGKDVWVNSTKSLIGHTLGASGAIEAIVTVLSIFNQTTHVSRNLEHPLKDLNFVTRTDSYPIKKAISQSFGFGGHNAVLVIGEYHP
ncbi:MAG: beta-ketoacyl-[acyl-carrier-protein] synthase family protein [Desulfatiglandaceae bacterium]